MYTEIKSCRICGNPHLKTVIELGKQALTGVFPASPNEQVTEGPLTLVKCTGTSTCGLVQLKQSYTLSEMYGDNYGYRSGLNPTMVEHLRSKVKNILSLNLLNPGDVVLDIGSNDGTTLAQYQRNDLTLVGMDPTITKFADYYPPYTKAIPEFFNAATFRRHMGVRRAKVVTSFSMFYDLEDPISFSGEVGEIMEDNGIWVLEQSYMPKMLSTNSYDTICHEHLEYYALAQIDWIAERCDMRVIDVELNDVNGGSFSIVIQKKSGQLPVSASVEELRRREAQENLQDVVVYDAFRERVQKAKLQLLSFLREAKVAGKRVVALGASTKGNVVLQYCDLDSSVLESIGEINPDKFGTVTPGTHIPIVDENELLKTKPDYVLVLPWHFRSFFESQSRYDHVSLVFALPELEVRFANAS